MMSNRTKDPSVQVDNTDEFLRQTLPPEMFAKLHQRPSDGKLCGYFADHFCNKCGWHKGSSTLRDAEGHPIEDFGSDLEGFGDK